MRQNTLLVALSALTVAAAQNFTINPGTVKPSDRADWCNAEYNSCGKLCGGNPTANDCDVDTLKYECTCANGTAPGLEYYIQTIPTFICEQAFSECVAANTASAKAQDECKANIKSKCGTLDPSKVQLGGGSSSDTTSSSAGSTPTTQAAGASSSKAAGQSVASSSSSHAAAAPTNAAAIGNGVAMVAAGVFAVLL